MGSRDRSAITGSPFEPPKFLIDECLSPWLADAARREGFPHTMHVNWLGLEGQPDWRLVQRAIRDEYVLVTSNRTDFTSLMAQEAGHPGLICMDIPQGRNSRDVQRSLFVHALDRIGTWDFSGQIFEVALKADGTAEIARYSA